MEERLQKYIARCGVASRRKSEELILESKIKVNGTIVRELGTKINPQTDIVEFNGNRIYPEERKVYIMLNKPEGYVTTLSDEKGRNTILDLIDIEERVFPIGRLDYDSSGLLILTNDGDIYNKIIHPRVEINKKYIAVCSGKFTNLEIAKFNTGVDIGGYVTSKANIEVIDVENYYNRKNDCETVKSTVEITIHEGKNRQIRRMCSALNHNVVELKRISVGDLKLGNLKKGNYRFLTESEIEYIKSL